MHLYWLGLWGDILKLILEKSLTDPIHETVKIPSCKYFEGRIESSSLKNAFNKIVHLCSPPPYSTVDHAKLHEVLAGHWTSSSCWARGRQRKALEIISWNQVDGHHDVRGYVENTLVLLIEAALEDYKKDYKDKSEVALAANTMVLVVLVLLVVLVMLLVLVLLVVLAMLVVLVAC